MKFLLIILKYTGGFDIIDSMDIELEGKTYTLAPKSEEETEDENSVWTYGDEEIDISTIQSAMNNLTASEFTDEEPKGEQEVRITLNLTDENFPQTEIVFYRYDGTNCLATIDGESFALVLRSSVVDCIEAVNAIVLN